MKNNLFKRLLAGTCTVCMLFFTSLPVMAAEYPDVTTGAWYYSYVQDVSDKGLMSGYNDGRFGPNDKLTRGQFATVLWRMNGSPDMGSSSFADVPATSFYAKASEWARVNGVITGYSDGRFGGNDNINREQVATILYRYSGGEANGNIWEYPDGSSVSTFAREGMAYAVGNGIISGDNGYLNPQGDVVRAVAATMISRFNSSNEQHTYDAGVETTAPTCTANGVKTFTCTECGHKKTGDILALGHNLSETVTQQPTCNAEGKKHISCSRGDYEKDEVVGATGLHAWKDIMATRHHPESIIKDGWTEYKDTTYCNGCGAAFEDALECGKHAGLVCGTGYHTRTETINHPAEIKPAWDEEYVDHKECTTCGTVSN